MPSSRELFTFCVVYDDLLASPEDTAGALFSSLGISGDCVPLALTAMRTHSQKRVFEGGKKKEEIQHLYRAITESDWEEADLVMRRLDLPFSINVEKEEFAKIFRSN